MSDHAAFLRAIIAEPDDDLPRLVYADWLDEHRQPERAEFVRVQVELAGYDSGRNEPAGETAAEVDRKWQERDARVVAIRRRERELGYEGQPNVSQWFAKDIGVNWPDPGAALYGSLRPAFIRGFVSAVTLSWADWQAHATALLGSAPIRRVNRARACGACRGDSSRVPWCGHGAVCPACRGQGTVDDWRGDGRVVLTTWPEFEWEGPGRWPLRGTDVTIDAADIPHLPLGTPGSEVRANAFKYALAIAYPGVHFELPAAQRWYDADEVAAMISRAEGDEALTGGRP